MLEVALDRKPAEQSAEVIERLDLRPEPGSSTLGSNHPGTSSAPPIGDLLAPAQN